MKRRFIGIILAASLAVSFTACDSGGAKSTDSGTAEASSEVSYAMDIPDIVASLSEEENNALVGEIKDGAYYNEYFGIKVTPGEGQTLVRDNDEAKDNAGPIPMADAFTEGWGGISVTSATDDWSERISVLVKPCEEGEAGLSEEELAEQNLLGLRKIDAMFDGTDEINEDDGRAVETVTIAGGEHPIVVSRYEKSTSASWVIAKDGFKMTISFNLIDSTDLTDLMACVSRL